MVRTLSRRARPAQTAGQAGSEPGAEPNHEPNPRPTPMPNHEPTPQPHSGACHVRRRRPAGPARRAGPINRRRRPPRPDDAPPHPHHQENKGAGRDVGITGDLDWPAELRRCRQPPGAGVLASGATSGVAAGATSGAASGAAPRDPARAVPGPREAHRPDSTSGGGGAPSGAVRGAAQRFHRRRRRSGTTGASGRSSSASAVSCPVVTRTAGSGGRGLACRGDPLGRGHTTVVSQPPQTQTRGAASPRGRRCCPGPSSSVHLMLCPTTGRVRAARPRSSVRSSPGAHHRNGPAGWEALPSGPSPTHAPPTTSNQGRETDRRSGRPGESHPRAPTEPCVTVSRYTALAILVTKASESMPNGRRASGTDG